MFFYQTWKNAGECVQGRRVGGSLEKYGNPNVSHTMFLFNGFRKSTPP